MNPPSRPRRRSRFRLRAVLLDAFGTLFYYGPDTMPGIFQRVVKQLELPVEPEILLKHWQVHESAFRGGRVWRNKANGWEATSPEQFSTYRAAWEQSFRLAAAELGLKDSFAEAAAEMIVADTITRHMYRDTRPALEAIGARVPMIIVSNADDDSIHGAVRHSGLSFSGIVHSEGERVYKPHPAIFQAALDLLGITDPTQVLYVGDRPFEDVQGPHSLGIPAVWVNRMGEDWPADIDDRPDYEVTNLLGLVDIVASKTLSAL